MEADNQQRAKNLPIRGSPKKPFTIRFAGS